MAYLAIGNKFYGTTVEIDLDSFSFHGGITDTTNERESDCISFKLKNVENTEAFAAKLKEIINTKRKDSQWRVTVRQPESWERNQKPTVSVRLVRGYAGLTNPASFSFTNDKEEFHF